MLQFIAQASLSPARVVQPVPRSIALPSFFSARHYQMMTLIGGVMVLVALIGGALAAANRSRIGALENQLAVNLEGEVGLQIIDPERDALFEELAFRKRVQEKLILGSTILGSIGMLLAVFGFYHWQVKWSYRVARFSESQWSSDPPIV